MSIGTSEVNAVVPSGVALDVAYAHRCADDLAAATAEEVLRWTVRAFPERAALSISFGIGGIVLLHMLREIRPGIPAIFVDTWMHFQETYEFKQRVVDHFALNLVEALPREDPGPLYRVDADLCCAIRKVEPMQRALAGVDAWISALRRDQSETRQAISVVESQEVAGRSLLKVYPIAAWSRARVWQYVREHELPYHPLLDKGYTSIGCWPCTRPVLPGEGERAGRWSGSGKLECGLHVPRSTA